MSNRNNYEWMAVIWIIIGFVLVISNWDKITSVQISTSEFIIGLIILVILGWLLGFFRKK